MQLEKQGGGDCGDPTDSGPPGDSADQMTIDSCLSKSEREPLWLTLSVVCLVLGGITFFLSQTVEDADLWGHVKFGRDIWHSGQIVQRDTYSYLAGDQPWINHEWLAEVVFGALFALGGPRALIAFKVVMVLLTVGLVYWYLMRQGLSALKGGIILLFATLLLGKTMLTLRPQIFTYPLFLATLLLQDAADRGHLRWLWGIPIVFAVWVNLHGGFLAGMAVVILWSFVRIVASFCHMARSDWKVRWSDVVFVASAFGAGLATLFNPYGARLLTFLVRPATVIRPDIMEWQPIEIANAYGIIYLVFLAVAVVGLLYSIREKRAAPLVVFLCVAILPLLAIRHTPLFALGIPILAGEHIADAWNRWSPGLRSTPGKRRRSRASASLAMLAMGGAVVLFWLSLPNFRCIHINRMGSGPVPAQAVAILRESGVSGNLAVFYNWGEYVIWHLSPQIKVSFDGRRETVYSDKIQEENWRFVEGREDWDTLLVEHDTHLALVPKTYPVFNLLELSPGWVLVHKDSVSGLFVRERSPLIPKIQAASPAPLPDGGEGLCFP